MARVRELGTFDEEIYFREVYMPLLESLGGAARRSADRR